LADTEQPVGTVEPTVRGLKSRLWAIHTLRNHFFEEKWTQIAFLGDAMRAPFRSSLHRVSANWGFLTTASERSIEEAEKSRPESGKLPKTEF
jgi:hypothetical protein